MLARRQLLVGAGGAALAMPWIRRVRAATPIDVFLCAGQSNDLGHADITDAQTYSPVPPANTSFQYYLGALTPAVDPVGDATFGSAWPEFCLTYNALTGHVVCVIPTAIGGSGQWVGQEPDNVNGVWDITSVSSHTPVAIAAAQAALLALSGLDYTPTFRGVLWCQGEADASYINIGTETIWNYISSFNAMRPVFLAADSLTTGQFYVFQTGSLSEDTTGALSHYRAVRNAQVFCVNGDSNAHMVFTGAVDFPAARSFTLQQTPTDVHYTQHGYNRMGNIGAINVVKQLGLV